MMSSLHFLINWQVIHVKVEIWKEANTNHQYDDPKLGLNTKGQRM